MPLQLDVFLLILRLLFIVLLYLFLMQVVIAIFRDLKKTESVSANPENKLPPVVGHLIVINNANKDSSLAPGMRFDLAPVTTIGRGRNNLVQLPDSLVSNEHALMKYRNGSWRILDVNSTYGTAVNDQKIPPNQEIPAKPGDTITIAFIKFQLIP